MKDQKVKVLTEQQSDYFWAVNYDDVSNYSVTIQVLNRHITAEVAIVGITVIDSDWLLAQVGITQVVSDRGVEEFGSDQFVTSIERTGVTSITFGVVAGWCLTPGRYSINIWS